MRGGRRRHARVVRLHGAGRDERGGALGQRVRHQELELARLVAAQPQPREVVALHEDARTARRAAERAPQARRLVERRGQRGQPGARAVRRAGGRDVACHVARLVTGRGRAIIARGEDGLRRTAAAHRRPRQTAAQPGGGRSAPSMVRPAAAPRIAEARPDRGMARTAGARRAAPDAGTRARPDRPRTSGMRGARRLPVGLVADDRPALRRQMHAELMGAAGHELDSAPGSGRARRRASGRARGSGSVAAAPPARTITRRRSSGSRPSRCVDGASAPAVAAPHHAPGTPSRTRARSPAARVRRGRFGDHEQPRRVLVEPLHEPRLPSALGRSTARAACHSSAFTSVPERCARDGCATMPGGLHEHEQRRRPRAGSSSANGSARRAWPRGAAAARRRARRRRRAGAAPAARPARRSRARGPRGHQPLQARRATARTARPDAARPRDRAGARHRRDRRRTSAPIGASAAAYWSR